MRIAATAAFAAYAFVSAAPCAARAPETPAAEAAIRATVERWYEELLKQEDGRYWNLVAPGFIEASPHYRHLDTGARKLGPRIYTSLAARALKFAWEIDSIRRDSSFAKVKVWERGYFYAGASKVTYEMGAATTFILERSEKDGRWLILAHQSDSQAIPAHKVTKPMPDLSGVPQPEPDWKRHLLER